MLTELKVYAKGTKAFFVDDQVAWIQATLTKCQVDEEARTVSLHFQSTSEEEEEEYKFSATFDELISRKKVLPPLCNPPVLEGVDDLTSLSHLNEPAVLHNLQTRYSMHNIYTYSGIVLVALNPFAHVPLYSQDTLEAYAGRMRGELEPHLFAISEDAFQGMVRDKRNQTIIVSGESGAGKTMSAKYIMRYFATAHEDSQKPSGGIGRVEEQILATNPVLESFGNAKTTRNDNSSRFGKFLEIRFDERHAIEAAVIRTYLLERSRLVYQPKTERNYHVFYQLLGSAGLEAGLDAGLDAELGLENKGWEDFHYTNQGETGTVQGVDDAREFRSTCEALEIIGVGRDRQAKVHRLLAALLHLGNVEILGGASERVGASIAEDDEACQRVVKLLGVDGALFRKWLTKRQIKTRTEKIVSNMSQAQAAVVRDSVAKFIYSHLFDWIVQIINHSLLDSEGTEGGPPASFIGVLDIYGFEHFEHNSFEQFCINYANEKLQQNFNRHVFKLEQEEYQREQLADWTFVDFQDNQPCIDLIEGKLGVLALLDEESRLQQGSDKTLVEKLCKQFPATGKMDLESAAAFFRKPRFGGDRFTVRHYAHDVEYEAEGFIEKNKDTVPEEIQNVLRSSTDTLLAEVVASRQPEETQKLSVRAARKPTLGSVFKQSLVQLMETIEATESHYIRCIKPNEEKQAWKWDAPMVLSQLRACGVLETIRISCAGYPSRLAIPEFIHRYSVLLAEKAKLNGAHSMEDVRELAGRILESAFSEPDRYQVGLTKVFFRAGMLAVAEKQRQEKLNLAATLIQSLARGYQQRALFRRQRESALAMQTKVRQWRAQRELARRRRERAVLRIQSGVRGYLARREFKKTKAAIRLIQSLARGWLARQTASERRQRGAAILIQRHVRGYQSRRGYKRKVQLVVMLQSRVRAQIARRQLKRRREEARSAEHFKQVTYKLEGRLMELSRQLDESKQRVSQLTEQLKAAQRETQQQKDTQETQVAKMTQQLSGQVDELARQKSEADTKCRELAEQLAGVRTELEGVQRQLAEQGDESARERRELEEKLKELELELESSRQQLAEAKSSQQAAAVPRLERKPSSVLRASEQASGRWKTAAGLSATGYEMADSMPPVPPIPQSASNGRMLDEQIVPNSAPIVSQPQGLQQRRGYSVDQPSRDLSPVESANNKRSTIGGEEGGRLAKMLSSLVSSSTTATITEEPVAEEPENEPPAFELRNEDEVREMLETDDGLISEVLNELIGDLQVPMPNLDAEYSTADLLFPAHLIGLCVIKMFQYNLSRRIDRLLMSAIARIQKKTATHESDYTSAFWLSNVFELLSIIKTSMTEHQATAYEYADSERAMNEGMQYLESLLSDIYFGWLKDLQKRFVKLIIPGVVESEALPGFTASDSGFFNRLMGTGPRESTVKIENILSFFNHMWRTMEFYYVDQAIMRQIISELLCNVGVTAFNNIIMRRNFCSWKRGMQIQYNLTRIEEWCKAHAVEDSTSNLDRLLQLVKLLQLQKSTEQDIDIMFEVCDLLNPQQIKKLLSIYAVSDYENPIVGQIMNEVSRRAVGTEKTDKVLLDIGDLNDQVLYLTARKVPAIETYIPAEYQMARVRALVESQTDVGDEYEEYAPPPYE